MSDELNTTTPATTDAPNTETTTDVSTPPTTETPPPAEPSQAEVAEQMRNEYKLTAEEEAPKGEEEKPAEGEPEQPFQLEFTEGTEIDEGLVGVATKHFKALGVTGQAAGSCVESIMAELQEMQWANLAKADAELKADWGAEYASRKQETAAFMRAFCNKRGYSLDRMYALETPDGYRLMYEVMETAGLVSAPTAGLRATSRSNDATWFKAASTPGTPEYAALNDTSNRSKWAENNQRYNRIAEDMRLRGV